jgi:hypothetical protein
MAAPAERGTEIVSGDRAFAFAIVGSFDCVFVHDGLPRTHRSAHLWSANTPVVVMRATDVSAT